MLNSIKRSVSGLVAQVNRLTTVSNNIANSTVTGFKRSDSSFSELLVDSLDHTTIPVRPENNLEVAHGAKHTAELVFTQGSFLPTGRPLDIALEGDGFLELRDTNGSPVYVKGASFSKDAAGNLVHDSGAIVPGVRLTEQMLAVDINTAGGIFAAGGAGEEQLGALRIVRFVNPKGLEALGSGRFAPTENSGAMTPDPQTKVWQGFLEASNVDMGEEMTSLIRAQRAYQANAQSIRTFDEMWGKTNSLRR